ncbi:MAG: mycofactocin biosynthesis chaperone MftB [Desertimonas sp.]
MLDRRLALDPQVALRPEPFGALAYHYDTRRLIFLKHPDVVRVVRSLDGHDTVADTLVACGIDESRWPSFTTALTALVDAGLLRSRESDRRPATAPLPRVAAEVGV